MDYEEEIQKIKDEFNSKITILTDKIFELTERLDTHKHNGYDLTSPLDGSINLKDQSFINIGNSQIASFTLGQDLSTETNRLFLGAGKDKIQGFADTSNNSQLELQHIQSTTNTFFYGIRPPIYITHNGSVVSITSAGSTLTDNTKNWETNSLAGAYLNVTDSTGTFKETKVIASNTATVITITGTWSFTDASSTYQVFMPIYLGSAQNPWRRIYTGEGTSEGIRFGYGATSNGQNGLLYMDSTGDLYWRSKAGASVKLN